MADFARWATAAEPGLGLEEGAFLRAYDDNRAAANELALEGSAVVPHIRSLVAVNEWSGTAGDLLAKLSKLAGEPSRLPEGWPKSPKAMGAQLRRLAPNLRATGLDVTELPREARTGRRLWRLRSSGECVTTVTRVTASPKARGRW